MNAHCQWFPKLTLPWIDVDQLDEIISWNITKLGDLIAMEHIGMEEHKAGEYIFFGVFQDH